MTFQKLVYEGKKSNNSSENQQKKITTLSGMKLSVEGFTIIASVH